MLINRNDTLSDILLSVSHELHRGALDRKHPFRFVNLATVDGNKANTRLVVLREVQEDMSFVFFTDKRSVKISDLSKNESATLLFWHPGKKVQVAVKGRTEIYNQDAKAKAYWASISIDGRKAYGSKLAPGTNVDRPELAHDWPSEISSEFFCVIKFYPEELDVLQLHKLSHYRAQYKYVNNEWLGSWVVP